jgi:hypothetical protein
MATTKKASKEAKATEKETYPEASLPKLFAFWLHSTGGFGVSAPVRGGEIKKVYDSGCIESKGLPGMSIRPISIVPLAAGKAILERVKAIEEAEKKEIEAVRAKWASRYAELVPGLPTALRAQQARPSPLRRFESLVAERVSKTAKAPKVKR